jgi:hypothetical protein
MMQSYTTRECNCTWHFYFTSVYVSNIYHACVQLSDGTSTSQVCMCQTEVTGGCSRQMAFLLHNRVCFKMTSRVSAAVRWHFLFTRVYVSNKHEAVRICLLALIIHKCVCSKQAWGVRAVVWWHFYFTRLYGSDRHETVRSFQMALLLHKFVCFEQKSRAGAAVRWHFCFTSVYVSKWHRAWVPLLDGTSHSQVCMFQTNMTRCAVVYRHF